MSRDIFNIGSRVSWPGSFPNNRPHHSEGMKICIITCIVQQVPVRMPIFSVKNSSTSSKSSIKRVGEYTGKGVGLQSLSFMLNKVLMRCLAWSQQDSTWICLHKNLCNIKDKNQEWQEYLECTACLGRLQCTFFRVSFSVLSSGWWKGLKIYNIIACHYKYQVLLAVSLTLNSHAWKSGLFFLTSPGISKS